MSDITFEDKCAEIKEKKQQMMDKMIEYYTPIVYKELALRNEDIKRDIENRNKPVNWNLNKMIGIIFNPPNKPKHLLLCEIKHRNEFGDIEIYNTTEFIVNVGKKIAEACKERYNISYKIKLGWAKHRYNIYIYY